MYVCLVLSVVRGLFCAVLLLLQVVAAYKARGFEVRSVHPEYGFLKVAQPAAVTAGVQHGGRAAPMANMAPWAMQQLSLLSPGDNSAGPINPRGAEAAARASADPEMVYPTWTSAGVSVAAMPMASSPSIASTIAALSEVPGVDNVEVNIQAHLMRKKKFTRSLQETVAASAICPVSKPKNGPDTDTGKYSESPPYGVRMVQADHPEMIEVSKEFAHKVIFCVIDTGLDRKNGEFGTTGELNSTAAVTMGRLSAFIFFQGCTLPWNTLQQCMHVPTIAYHSRTRLQKNRVLQQSSDACQVVLHSATTYLSSP